MVVKIYNTKHIYILGSNVPLKHAHTFWVKTFKWFKHFVYKHCVHVLVCVVYIYYYNKNAKENEPTFYQDIDNKMV